MNPEEMIFYMCQSITPQMEIKPISRTEKVVYLSALVIALSLQFLLWRMK